MQISQPIEAPIEKVWDILTDTRQWPLWGPSISAVACSQRHITAGATGRVKTVIGIWVPFRILRFDPPSYWSWLVAGVPATGHRLQPLGPGRCALTFEVPAPVFPYALVCRRALNNISRLACRG
ncbi:MAG: SRPBCC family protein [Desulfuromonadales bacterium]|nr:SRPBCC family protein [Desulfuromonadales bacterium]